MFKNRTGAINKIQAGDRIWHLGANEPAVQTYTPGPVLVPGVWFEYEIVLQGNDYSVFLTNTQTLERKQTTALRNSNIERGRAPGLLACKPIQATRSRGGTSASSLSPPGRHRRRT